MPLSLPHVYCADVVGIPAFSILDRAGGTLPDAILLAIFIAASTWFVIWGKAQIRRIDTQQEARDKAWREAQEKRDKEWSDGQKKLQEDWEETIAIMQAGIKESFKQLNDTHKEQIAAMHTLVAKLEDQKTWSSNCELKHAAIEEWKKSIEERLRDGAKKFETIDERMHEISRGRA